MRADALHPGWTKIFYPNYLEDCRRRNISVSYTHLKKDVASVEQSLNTLISNASHLNMDTYHAQ